MNTKQLFNIEDEAVSNTVEEAVELIAQQYEPIPLEESDQEEVVEMPQIQASRALEHLQAFRGAHIKRITVIAIECMSADGWCLNLTII